MFRPSANLQNALARVFGAFAGLQNALARVFEASARVQNTVSPMFGASARLQNALAPVLRNFKHTVIDRLPRPEKSACPVLKKVEIVSVDDYAHTLQSYEEASFQL